MSPTTACQDSHEPPSRPCDPLLRHPFVACGKFAIITNLLLHSVNHLVRVLHILK